MSGGVRIRRSRRNHDAEMAELYRQFNNNGKKRAVLDALLVCICACPEKPVPRWVKRQFGKALHDVMMVKAVSWDDVFGKPHEGRKIAQIRKERALRGKVTKRVYELRRQRPKPPDIFQVVADENDIGRATCKRYFEREMKWFKNPPTF